jgi:hypothetical protein
LKCERDDCEVTTPQAFKRRMWLIEIIFSKVPAQAEYLRGIGQAFGIPKPDAIAAGPFGLARERDNDLDSSAGCVRVVAGCTASTPRRYSRFHRSHRRNVHGGAPQCIAAVRRSERRAPML